MEPVHGNVVQAQLIAGLVAPLGILGGEVLLLAQQQAIRQLVDQHGTMRGAHHAHSLTDQADERAGNKPDRLWVEM